MPRKLTDYEKLEVAKDVIDILDKALKNDGPFSTAHGEWIRRAKEEVSKRQDAYLKSEYRLDLRGV
jgi:hypothetical protein